MYKILFYSDKTLIAFVDNHYCVWPLLWLARIGFPREIQFVGAYESTISTCKTKDR